MQDCEYRDTQRTIQARFGVNLATYIGNHKMMKMNILVEGMVHAKGNHNKDNRREDRERKKIKTKNKLKYMKTRLRQASHEWIAKKGKGGKETDGYYNDTLNE